MRGPNRMKKVFLTLGLLGVLVLLSRSANAQVYDVYYYWDGAQYQQYAPQYELYSYGAPTQYPEQLYDPYYQLHVLHYQLYLPQYQVAQYPAYPYVPCCFGGPIIVPKRHVRPVVPPGVSMLRPPISPLPRFVTPAPNLFRR